MTTNAPSETATRTGHHGQPAPSDDAFVSLRLPRRIVQGFDDWAKRERRSRQGQIIVVLEHVLAHGLADPRTGEAGR